MKVHYYGPNIDWSEEKLIDQLLHPPTNMIAIDTETVSLTDRTMLGFGIAINPNEAYYIPVWPERSEILESVYHLLTRVDIFKLGHNINFDIGVLRQFAVFESYPYCDVTNTHDTSIIANISALDPDLHTLALKHTKLNLDFFTIQDILQSARESTGKRSVNMTDADPDQIALKCANDVRATYALWEPLVNQMNTNMWDCYQVDRELLGILKTVERKGLALNQNKLYERYKELLAQLELYEDWGNDNGFSISSPTQVGMFLGYNNIVLPTTRSGKQLDTSEEILQRFNTNPLVRNILEYRKLAKVKSTYVEPFIGKDRFYTHFRLDLATGRLASGGEKCLDHICSNGQNIPANLRDMFTPDSGIYSWADMSQLEMRVFAYLSQDKALLELYKTNQSVHNDTFKIFYPDKPRYKEDGKDSDYYTKAKVGNFTMIFDGQDSTIASQCEIPVLEAKRFRQIWFARHPDAKLWMESKQNTGSTYEETIFGRRMRIPPDYERGKSHSNKCRINYPVQGSGADLNKRALLMLYKKGYLSDLRLQVHDELLNDGIEFYDNFPHELVSNIHPDIYVPWEVSKGEVWI